MSLHDQKRQNLPPPLASQMCSFTTNVGGHFTYLDFAGPSVGSTSYFLYHLVGNSCLQQKPPPGSPQCSGKHGADYSLGFRAVLLSWDPVSGRQSSRWRLGNPRFLSHPPPPPLHLSSGCLRHPEDVTWPTPGKFLPSLFSKPCFVFYYRCLKIALLSWHGSGLLQTAGLIQ